MRSKSDIVVIEQSLKKNVYIKRVPAKGKKNKYKKKSRLSPDPVKKTVGEI